MLVLDGIFNGDDVIAPPGIDQVKQRRQGRGLAASGRPGEQHQPLPAIHQLGQRRPAGAAIRAKESVPAISECWLPASRVGSAGWRENARSPRAQNKSQATYSPPVPPPGASRQQGPQQAAQLVGGEWFALRPASRPLSPAAPLIDPLPAAHPTQTAAPRAAAAGRSRWPPLFSRSSSNDSVDRPAATAHFRIRPIGLSLTSDVLRLPRSQPRRILLAGILER